ncbi:MAG: SpoIID/LytB domain-containing protein [Synergistaceae bacterium]|nr:SpoIID/LytB domain-containing protein [Synergistaceae bacterium]
MKPVYSFFKLFKFTLFCLILILSAEIFSAPALAREIRVRLSESGKYGVSSAGTITLIDSANKSHSMGKSVTLSVSKGTATSGKSKFSLPVTLKSSSALEFNNRKYRGTLRITKNGELVNVLDVEDYLRGVLKAEANPNWPMEYLKVQAIVSRTYATRESQAAAAKSRGYDVTDSTSSQVYHGMGAETQRTDQAVRETKDKVLAYGDELAFTPFHSDSGGATANNSDVWGKDLPYLRSVKEPMAYQSPNSSWEARLSPSELSAAIKKVSLNVGTIKDIKVLNTDKHGRAVDLRITGTTSSATIKASSFRTAVGPNKLKSTFLVLPGTNETKQAPPAPKTEVKAAPKTEGKPSPQTEAKAAPKADNKADNIDLKGVLTPQEDALLAKLFAEGAFTNNEMMDILLKPEKRKEYLYRALGRGTPPKQDSPAPAKTPPAADIGNEPIPAGASIPFSNGYFIFRGKGWGHGVGMSQYGAMNLANNGWNAEKILTHYFPGTKVKTMTAKK